jgi:nitrite reductase/ring-hydroxylating ferredoxin subunit
MNDYTKLIVLICFLLFTATEFGCEKDRNEIIPYVPVNRYFNIRDPEFFDLSVPNNSVTIKGGLNGIIVYRVSVEEFVAYDRTCTYEPENNCAVETDNSSSAKCPCCGSRFFLIDGSPLNGPAQWPLKPYKTTFDGTYVRITN